MRKPKGFSIPMNQWILVTHARLNSICRLLRRDQNTASIAIIMLTAKAEEVDRIVGLEIGADDYVVKPFSPRELVARVKAAGMHACHLCAGNAVVEHLSQERQWPRPPVVPHHYVRRVEDSVSCLL